MDTTKKTDEPTDEPNEWTLMFFFAGDNQLSPSMVSQLKAIKDAGFQRNTTVLVRFDPNEKGAPTRIFDVNRKRKMGDRGTMIGDGPDPFVRNLIEDEITREELGESEGEGAKISAIELDKSDTLTADGALSSFLEFSRENYYAKHYMLFLVGHGGIVGNDAFLPDDSPDTAITLIQLGEILREFADAIRKEGSAFELVGMHSCSMSAIEVAYQLKGTAKYMMSTEGISFVGSWPYRQLLKKTFNTIEKAKEREAEVDVEVLLRKLHYLCLHNSTDFMFAGYSADLCLCALRPKKVEELTAPLQALTKALKAVLRTQDDQEKERGKELILLAHWKSQSYWQENYTDLYDFCRCLSEKCDETNKPQKKIKTACNEMMKKLNPPWRESDPFDNLVVYSDHFGPTYQYSHGLSVYFPWSKPVEEEIINRYKEYTFKKELGDDSWLSFLEKYFEVTKRQSREVENGVGKMPPLSREEETRVIKQQPQAVSHIHASDSQSGEALPPGPEGKPSPSLSGGKTSPSDSGGACNCASIKNYPMEFSLSPGAKDAFKPAGQTNQPDQSDQANQR